MDRLAFKIRGMDCAEEIALLKRELGPVVGGEDRLSFDLINGKLSVTGAEACTDCARIVAAVRTTGMDAIPWADHVATEAGRAEALRGQRGRAEALRGWDARALLSGASAGLLAAGFLFHALDEGFIAALSSDDGFPLAARLFYLGSVIAGGWFVAPKAVYAARRFRPDMNLLMAIAVIGAAVIGQWFEAATVSFLFALALLLESWSVQRARRAISALFDLTPRKARCVCPRDGDIEEIPVENVKTDAIVVVRPGERIPLDGVVTQGITSVNQAPITGESVPVAKAPGDGVFAGAVNNEGAFQFRVTRPAGDTTLARIIRLIEEAQSRRAPSEQWVERFARYYTPAMMGLALAVALIPPILGLGAWGRWFYEALVVLVIACPCALVISTPVSVVASLARAAHAGVLIKGGVFVEVPARLRAIALDKTGTLTHGRPAVQRVVPLNGHSEDELLERAAAIESLSEHPVARAILDEARKRGLRFERAGDYRALPGKGAEAMLDGRRFWVGSHRFVHEIAMETPAIHDQALELEDAGHSVLFFGNETHVCGLISVADGVRPEAREAVEALRRAGIERIVLLTGDNEGTARAVAKAAGVDAFEAELLPEDKVAAVRRLVEQYGAVAMIGDGVNDAPAMAAATLGIAMGAAGTDAAIETADIALMADDLLKVPWLVHHARRTVRVIRQNVAFAIGVKALFVMLALAGWATLWMAIAADMGASLLVIFNGLRLLDARR